MSEAKKMDRRSLFRSVFQGLRKHSEPETPQRDETKTPTEAFSIQMLYASRAEKGVQSGTTIPTFHVRSDSNIETSSVGVGRITNEVLPQAQTQPIIRGFRPKVREHVCLAYHSFCFVCSERCPVPDAIVVENGRPQIRAELCNGCGLCIAICPAPVNAIELVSYEERSTPTSK